MDGDGCGVPPAVLCAFLALVILVRCISFIFE